MGEEIFLKLRYCFQAGYTLPQYCIDNGIKRPLFVMEKSDEWFLRELHAQFQYDKRLSARFCFIDGDQTTLQLGFYTLGTHLIIKHISEVMVSYYDAVIFLTKKDFNVGDRRIIRFAELEKFFIQRTYADIPLLNFLQRFPLIFQMILDVMKVESNSANDSQPRKNCNKLLKIIKASI